ncbi:MAG: hypothetical protein ACLFRG_02775 [Desulfococcaceae bacterium]
MTEIRRKKVCKCENCGNEAEMEITCSLEAAPETPAAPPQGDPTPETRRAKGHGVCAHCGNEADMWIDL